MVCRGEGGGGRGGGRGKCLLPLKYGGFSKGQNHQPAIYYAPGSDEHGPSLNWGSGGGARGCDLGERAGAHSMRVQRGAFPLARDLCLPKMTVCFFEIPAQNGCQRITTTTAAATTTTTDTTFSYNNC